MMRKYPQAPTPSTPTGPLPQPFEVSEADVHRALMAFPGSTAPGHSGLRVNHLKEAISCPLPVNGSLVLSALSCLVNYLAAGRTTSFVIPHLCGATLLAIRKKNGRMCPIPVGEVLRRLTSKSLSCAIHSVWPLPFFFPYNFESEFDMDVKPLSMQPLASWNILPSPQMIDGLFSWIFPMPLIASTGSPCSSNRPFRYKARGM